MAELNSRAVTIPYEKYKELINLETRIEVIVELIEHKGFVSVADLLCVLGTDSAVELMHKLAEKEEKEAKKYAEKYGNAESEV